MKKLLSKIGLAGLVVVFITVSSSVSVQAATFTVNSTIDAADANPGDGFCQTFGGECTVRAAIMEANVLTDRDTIKVPAGTYLLTISGAAEDQGSTGDLDITGDLTIEGSDAGGTTIRGEENFQDRIIHVRNVTLEISGVTLQNGTVVGNGGGLRNQKGTVTLTNCSVVGNKTTGGLPQPVDAEVGVQLRGSGGGIFNTGTLRLISSTIDENIAVDHGGGVASDTRTSRVLLEQNFIVSNNKTVRGSGGGIFINRGTLSATTGRIVENRAGDPESPDFVLPASGDAGGIGTDKGTSMASLMNVMLLRNSALEDGGAIENEAGTMTITNCVVSDNRSAEQEGGGIENDRGTLTVRNSRIMNNEAANVGGGIHNANGRLIIIASTVSGNIARRQGGGIYNRENPFLDIETGQLTQTMTSAFSLVNSTISGNRAEESIGGGIVNSEGATAMVSNSTVARNSIFRTRLVAGGGSAITNFGTMTLSHSTVALNGPGGARGGGAIANSGDLTISSTILANNPFANCSQLVFFQVMSLGYNLSSDDSSCRRFFNQTGDQNNVPAGLDPSGLQDNGGPTNTIALLPSSPAVDKGKAFDPGEAHDQRGAARFNFADIPDAMGGDGSDIGAFELQAIDGTVDVTGGTIRDNIFGSGATLTIPPGALSAPTTVTIDVLDLDAPLPTGFSAPGTRFVNIELKPVPAFPVGPPGLTVVLPLANPLAPGTRLDLFRVDPASSKLVPEVGVTGLPVSGTVDADGLSATFTGIARLSTIVGLIPAIEVPIDIKPGSFPNSINPRSRGVIPVVILTTDTFDATTVDPGSVRFGPAETSAFRHKIKDVDRDGDQDLLLRFKIKKTGIQCEDTSGSLTGQTVDGQAIQGTDSIETVGCRRRLR